MVSLSHAASQPRARHRRFFIGIAILMLVVVALGFGKSFYVRPLFSSEPLPSHLVAHGIVMSAWFLLFLVQAALVSAKRIDLHRALGIGGMVLAACVVITGIDVHLNLIPSAIERGLISKPEDGLEIALSSLSGLLPFVVLVFLAVLLRRRGDTHKRLMFWSFVGLLGPAFANTRPLGQVLDSLVAPHLPFFPSDFIWFFVLMAYDWKTLRRFHPATYITFALLTGFFIFATPWIAGNETLQELLLTHVLSRAQAG
jgi:hypothetical protein